jgi:membrane associated rhomboid family serine protease
VSTEQARAAVARRCYRHPDRETWVSCTRCERPICPECLRPASVGFQCPECVKQGNATVRRPTAPYGGQAPARAGVVSLVLGLLNVVAFVVTVATAPGGLSGNTNSRLFDELELVPLRVAVDGEYWRLIGSAFLHIGLLHLAGNMLSLAIVGPALERLFGWWRFLAIYLVAAVAGASGAIYGLFAATLIVVRKLGLDARFMVLAVGLNFAVSFAPGISLLGHLGGFLAGGLLALAMVYAPKGSRTSLQILAIGVLLAIMVSLVLIRTDMLLPLAG